jgi:NAD(P)-dependent dehydrogenase (short-subunit alcohol dehydrogenase family)
VQIDGSVTLVTGGASGLGRGAAEALCQRGGKVAILDLPNQSPERRTLGAARPVQPRRSTHPGHERTSWQGIRDRHISSGIHR